MGKGIHSMWRTNPPQMVFTDNQELDSANIGSASTVGPKNNRAAWLSRSTLWSKAKVVIVAASVLALFVIIAVAVPFLNSKAKTRQVNKFDSLYHQKVQNGTYEGN